MGIMGGGAGGGGAGGGGAGGGGAGGGGAGGGGAGGGGAGGGGAGGGGAGGGGAGGGTGHAGGPSSALLNTALIVTQDAVTGFWDGRADASATPLAGLPDADDPLDHLDPSRRVSMLVSELAGRFSVSGTASRMNAASPPDASPPEYVPGHAVLKLDDAEIFATTAPKVEDLEHQLTWIRNYADLRFDRVAEINSQLGDILSFVGLAGQLDSGGRKYSLELLMATQSLAYGLEMQIKNLCWTPRPISLSTRVQPMIQTPDHSSFPSGHATEAFALATVLHRLMTPTADLQQAITGTGGEQAMVFRIANRIAANRTVAGVHFPIDSGAGAVLGCMIGEAVWSVLTLSTDRWQAKFDLGQCGEMANYDFLLSKFPFHDWQSQTISAPTHGPVAAAYLAQTTAEWGRS